MTFAGLDPAAPLALVATGPAGEVATRLARVGPALARELGLTLLPPLAPPLQPHRALAALAAAAPGASLAAVPLDPGLTLADGSSWADALGAWRQPTLLLIAVDQLATGTAAATRALLHQTGVPLLGLVQWGSPWQPQLRRRDGLPWLGALAPDGAPEGVDLRQALALAAALQGEPPA